MDMFELLKDPLRSKVVLIINGKKQQSSGMRIPPSQNKFIEIIKRFYDLCFSLITLIILSPILLLISLMILIPSGWPILFCQNRPGKDGKLFKIYKFRTMKKNAEEILKKDKELYRKYIENDCKLKPEDDPRIIKMGLLLRRSSLDEIPQIFNVIKGDMSIVGPRPVLPEQIVEYGEHTDEFLSVKPGMTGLWQVVGRSKISYPERKYLDLLYIRNKSIPLDFKILLRTVKAIYIKEGAH